MALEGDEMKTKSLMLAGLLCFMCSVVAAQDIYVTSSPSGNFSAYHTYAWGQRPNPNQIASPIMAQEAQTQINTQLQTKGLKLVQESENPDLLVVGSGGMKAETSYTAMGMRGFGGGMGTITPQQNVVGTLIVDIYDLKAKQMVWRGVAQGTLNQKNSQKNMQLLDKAVVKMFKKYPS
jgi:uncharacterized protein DUF4136